MAQAESLTGVRPGRRFDETQDYHPWHGTRGAGLRDTCRRRGARPAGVARRPDHRERDRPRPAGDSRGRGHPEPGARRARGPSARDRAAPGAGARPSGPAGCHHGLPAHPREPRRPAAGDALAVAAPALVRQARSAGAGGRVRRGGSARAAGGAAPRPGHRGTGAVPGARVHRRRGAGDPGGPRYARSLRGGLALPLRLRRGAAAGNHQAAGRDHARRDASAGDCPSACRGSGDPQRPARSAGVDGAASRGARIAG